MATLGAIGAYSTGQRFAWRGMSSADYTVEASIQRAQARENLLGDEATVRERELDTLRRARNWGLGVGRYGVIDDLQLLADLQHYGVPTRLVDFTSNPMTALWFACQDPSADGVSKTGLLLALNVTGWPVHSSGDAPLTLGNLTSPWANTLEQSLTGDPFLVRTVEPNVRAAAQEGYFVAGRVPEGHVGVFRSFSVPFEPLPQGTLEFDGERGRGAPRRLPFVAVLIKSSLKSKLLRYLDGSYDRSARTLFPDFPGFREFGTAVGGGEPSAAVEIVDSGEE
ncbi:FRG domain-containing protein [Microbacterium lacticum]|uniref:FRG domain-containing protein n=1 Tax=Microbacterium lacticum TaxID=33885 RepID=UPI00242E1170|nr:FRG domain-containing protein [Microbacterium lacticum]